MPYTKSLFLSYMIQPSLLSAFIDLQYFRPRDNRDRELVDSKALGILPTFKKKIEWTVKVYDANYFIDKSVEHRQQRFRISH